MPRKDWGPVTRRSTRLASQTNSVASSRASSVVSQETNTVEPPKGKGKSESSQPTRKRQTGKAAEFDTEHAIARIMRFADHAHGYVDSLTNQQKGAVIKVFADREEDLLHRIRCLEEEKEDISAELAKAAEKRKLRDFLFRESVHKAAQKLDKEAAEAAEAAAKSSSEDAVPEMNGEKVEEAQEQGEVEMEETSTETDEESTLPEGLEESTPVQAPRPASLLRRVFSTIASPFSRKAVPLEVASIQTDSSPLGELPASRKRPAPEALPETTLEPSSLPKTRRPETPGGPSTRNPTCPTSLDTITEYTEPASFIPAVDVTPSRPPMQTPSRPRTIASVRRGQQAANTLSRTWTEPRRPRDTNADRRLEKLHRYQQVRDELAALERDADLKDVVAHRVKRVKVDELAHIPHNRPGDAVSTFRVPDIDSDDEMEVDDETELRGNIFAQAADSEPGNKPVNVPAKAPISNTINVSAKAAVDSPTPAPVKISTKDTIENNKVSSVDTLPTDEDDEVYDWPDLGSRRPEHDQLSKSYLKDAADTFIYGLKHYQATGEVLTLY